MRLERRERTLKLFGYRDIPEKQWAELEQSRKAVLRAARRNRATVSAQFNGLIDILIDGLTGRRR